MTDDLFAPSPELQEEIDEALQKRREARQNKGWTSKKGVLLSKRERVFPIASPAVSASSGYSPYYFNQATAPSDLAAVMHQHGLSKSGYAAQIKRSGTIPFTQGSDSVVSCQESPPRLGIIQPAARLEVA